MIQLSSNLCIACCKALKGRTDKKFCDEYCRNTFNNKCKAATSNYTRNVINAIRKNRYILEGILGKEEVIKTTRERLLSRGFQFKYHTHAYENKKGNQYIFCFEFGYLSLDNDWFIIVKRTSEQ